MDRHIEIIEANLSLAAHQADVLALTAAYALDPMGNGGPLPAGSLERLIPGLRAHPTTLILLAYVDGTAVGIATCFRGFSTFYAQPLLNIHDLAVLPEFRGQGIGARLLEEVEHRAAAAWLLQGYPGSPREQSSSQAGVSAGRLRACPLQRGIGRLAILSEADLMHCGNECLNSELVAHTNPKRKRGNGPFCLAGAAGLCRRPIFASLALRVCVICRSPTHYRAPPMAEGACGSGDGQSIIHQYQSMDVFAGGGAQFG